MNGQIFLEPILWISVYIIGCIKIKKLCLTCCAEELDDVLLAGLALVKGTWVGSETNKKWHYKPHNNHVIHLFILVFFKHISWLNIFLKFSSLSLYISLVLLCFDGGSEWGVGGSGSVVGGVGLILTHVLCGLAVAWGGIVTPCALSHLWFLHYNDKKLTPYSGYPDT